MDRLLAWCAFLGAWLLVAGPVFQAAVELDDLSFKREEVLAARAAIDEPQGPSPWWWLVPPAGYVLQRRHDRQVRRAVMAALDRDQVERFVDFTDKATGWMFVACGAFLLAAAETWALREDYEWPVAVFWVLVPVLAVLCALYTATRMNRSRGVLAAKEPEA